ncbi:hypothetical protein M5689_019235 [Euphorbia peplus]|nr:hypothetical protein M5689_019235 [Euphorbia peplus]
MRNISETAPAKRDFMRLHVCEGKLRLSSDLATSWKVVDRGKNSRNHDLCNRFLVCFFISGNALRPLVSVPLYFLRDVWVHFVDLHLWSTDEVLRSVSRFGPSPFTISSKELGTI